MIVKKMMCILVALVMSLSLAFAQAENETVQVILSAGTTQAFTGESVSAADIETILQAGLKATSAINQQPWYFVVIENQDVMEEIAGSGGMPAGIPSGMPSGVPSGAPAGFPEGMTPPQGVGNMPGGAPSMPAASGAAKAALGDSPVAIVIYMNEQTSSPNASFDCGLACQNMVIAASALGYGTKIISSPTMSLNGANHDSLCEKLGVDPAYQAVAVLLIGYADQAADMATGASVRSEISDKVSFVK